MLSQAINESNSKMNTLSQIRSPKTYLPWTFLTTRRNKDRSQERGRQGIKVTDNPRQEGGARKPQNGGKPEQQLCTRQKGQTPQARPSQESGGGISLRIPYATPGRTTCTGKLTWVHYRFTVTTSWWKRWILIHLQCTAFSKGYGDEKLSMCWGPGWGRKRKHPSRT